MTHITEVVRRIKALLLMGDELDGNYREIVANTLDLTNAAELDDDDPSKQPSVDAAEL